MGVTFWLKVSLFVTFFSFCFNYKDNLSSSKRVISNYPTHRHREMWKRESGHPGTCTVAGHNALQVPQSRREVLEEFAFLMSLVCARPSKSVLNFVH